MAQSRSAEEILEEQAEAISRQVLECGWCHMPLSNPAEYHPHGFCILFENGIDPKEFVREAHHESPKLEGHAETNIKINRLSDFPAGVEGVPYEGHIDCTCGWYGDATAPTYFSCFDSLNEMFDEHIRNVKEMKDE